MTTSTWETTTTNAAQTEQLAERIGRAIRGGEVIELISDLGGGKTTFTRGLVRGVGSTDPVASPTFTLSKVYQAADVTVHHFDFYRLHEAGIMADELAELFDDPKGVVIVEWADVVQHVLPDTKLTIDIKQTPSGDRRFTFHCPEPMTYLLEAVQQ